MLLLLQRLYVPGQGIRTGTSSQRRREQIGGGFLSGVPGERWCLIYINSLVKKVKRQNALCCIEGGVNTNNWAQVKMLESNSESEVQQKSEVDRGRELGGKEVERRTGMRIRSGEWGWLEEKTDISGWQAVLGRVRLQSLWGGPQLRALILGDMDP